VSVYSIQTVSFKTTILAIFILFCLIFSGCVQYRKYTGQPLAFNPDDIIKPGYTKKQEVLEALGPPSIISNQYVGEIFVYEYKLRKNDIVFLGDPFVTGIFLFEFDGLKNQRDALVILFDQNDVVESYAVSKQITE
jgi:outer membrane protein assembly factor BamE (lipoprotein component of BamABCDE complex)